jgi:hypothetical protein
MIPDDHFTAFTSSITKLGMSYPARTLHCVGNLCHFQILDQISYLYSCRWINQDLD